MVCFLKITLLSLIIADEDYLQSCSESKTTLEKNNVCYFFEKKSFGNLGWTLIWFWIKVLWVCFFKITLL